jgi:hypothetical protein
MSSQKVNWKPVVASAVFAGIGLSFISAALIGGHERSLSEGFFLLSAGLGGAALSVQPSIIKEPVSMQNGKIDMPKFRGLASFLNILSMFFFAMAVLIWIFK